MAICVQIALVDVLTSLGLKPDGILGHSVGELACAYADGTLTAEQTVQVAYWRGQSLVEADVKPGAMAAVGSLFYTFHYLFLCIGLCSAVSYKEFNIHYVGLFMLVEDQS